MQRKLQTLMSQHALPAPILFLPRQQTLLIAPQPVRQLAHRLAPMRQGVLFFHGHLRKGLVVPVGHKDAVPTKAPAGFGGHNLAATLARKQHGIGVGGRTEGQRAHGRRGLVVGIGRQNVVESFGFQRLLEPFDVRSRHAACEFLKENVGWIISDDDDDWGAFRAQKHSFIHSFVPARALLGSYERLLFVVEIKLTECIKAQTGVLHDAGSIRELRRHKCLVLGDCCCGE